VEVKRDGTIILQALLSRSCKVHTLLLEDTQLGDEGVGCLKLCLLAVMCSGQLNVMLVQGLFTSSRVAGE